MGSLAEDNTRISNVCIVGAGPTGIAAAKYLLAEDVFSQISIIEQRAVPGGLWNYNTSNKDGPISVPQTSPKYDADQPVWTKNGAEFMTPVYERLETNIPRDLMGFSDQDWPDHCQLFPQHEEVVTYIQKYAKDVHDLITFNTQVVDIRQDPQNGWSVTSRHLSQNAGSGDTVRHFDAVIVANGHYNVPHIPSVTGIEAWNEAYPGSITHSKFYRLPESFTGKKVIVCGNAASGIDIAAQVVKFCRQPLIQSQRSESYLASGKRSDRIQEKPPITEYVVQDRAIRFADNTIEYNVDCILYCTGYFYSYPFLQSLSPPVVTSGERVENTYQHIFYWPNPTLAIPALNQKVIPFPLAEAQAAVIARVFSGRLTLPKKEDMNAWEDRLIEETGNGKSFHVLQFPKDADYINMLHDWAMNVDKPGGQRIVGKTPPRWGEKQYWTRQHFPAIKKAFQDYGEQRHSKRTLESVGFDFEDWEKQKLEEEQMLA